MQEDEIFRVEFFYWHNDILLNESLLYKGTAEEAADFAKLKMDVKREAGREPFGLTIYRPVIYNRRHLL